MPYYITVSSGPRADQAQPVLAVSDQRLVQAMLRAIGRLASKPEVSDGQRVLRLVAPETNTDVRISD